MFWRSLRVSLAPASSIAFSAMAWPRGRRRIPAPIIRAIGESCSSQYRSACSRSSRGSASTFFNPAKAFAGHVGFGGILILVHDLGVLLAGLVGLLELLERPAGLEQRAGRPIGVFVHIVHRQKRGHRLLEFALGEVGFANLKLSAG